MAHIANCLVDSGDERTISPPPLHPNDTTLPAWSSWRMQQPQPERKYQLFPKTGPLPPAPTKSVNPEKILGPGAATVQAPAPALSTSPAQSGSEFKPLTSSLSLRLKIKEHGLIRRRKISVPDLGPMTTVQEGMLDSPTIPGRPPFQERSIGSVIKKPAVLEGTSFFFHDGGDDIAESEVESPCIPTFPPMASNPQPVPPKQLAPLVIPLPDQQAAKPSQRPSRSRNRSGSTSTDAPRRPARPDDPPHLRGPASVPLPASAVTTMAPPFCVPASAVATIAPPFGVPTSSSDSRTSPRAWEAAGRTTPTPGSAPLPHPPTGRTTPTLGSAPLPPTGRTTPTPGSAPLPHLPTGEGSMTPRSDAASTGHRRNLSESGSIMDRGRPRNRHDRRVGAPLRRMEDKRMNSIERKAFETLPDGVKAADAADKIPQTEIDLLYQQALGQASRFQVLRQEDVETLSMELRQLDERTEYLRRTYTSLRAGRRNLHSRICQYLRSPLVASFRSESMLKQEEALAELDASIDDWIGKLDQAENRRTRVRQKLLEHVCAATTLKASPSVASVPAAPAAVEPLHSAMCIQPAMRDISTPPRSPSKPTHSRNASSDSTASTTSVSSATTTPPSRGAAAHVPSTIFEQPMVEEVAAALAADNPRASCLTRDDVESIRIYADSDVYELLADVESEFTKMSADMFVHGHVDDGNNEESRFEAEKTHHLAQSEDLLVGFSVSAPDTAKPMPLSPMPPPAPAKNSPATLPSKRESCVLTIAQGAPKHGPPKHGPPTTALPVPPPRSGPPTTALPPIPPSKNSLAATSKILPEEDQLVFLSSAVFKPDGPMAAV